MLLQRVCGSQPVIRLTDDMDHLFDRLFRDPWGVTTGASGSACGWRPSIDVSESDTEVTVQAEVPGVDPKDIEVTVSGQVLTISGEKKESTEEKGEDSCCSERRFGSFRRSVRLPTSVDSENVTAEHKNGVLLIRLNKRKNAVPKRIAVKGLD